MPCNLANDFLSGLQERGLGCACAHCKPALITCLANDAGYDRSSCNWLQARAGDVLVVFRCGNSPTSCRRRGSQNARYEELCSAGCPGQSQGGGRRGDHFEIDDMQIAEDVQLIVGHMIMVALRMSRSGAGRRNLRGHAGNVSR